MNHLLKYLKTSLYLLTAVLAGVILFAATAGFDMEKTILNSEFHGKLFVKNDLYARTHEVVLSSIADFTDGLKKNSPQNFEQHKDIFLLLEKSFSKDNFYTNLDSIRVGLFQYFRDERKFLPDIYLNTHKDTVKADQNSPAQSSTSQVQALTKIDKVNLGAILQYINRSDIVDYLSFIRLFFYMVHILPGMLTLLFILLFLVGLSLFRKFLDILRWMAAAFLTFGSLGLTTGAALSIYAFFVMPKTVYPIAMSIPLDNDIIISYIRDCLTPISTFLSVSGILCLGLTAAIYTMPKFLPIAFTGEQTVDASSISCSRIENRIQQFQYDRKSSSYYNILKNSLYALSIIAVSIAILLKLISTDKDFKSNDFSSVILKIKGANTVTEVIAAKDAGIYDIQVKLVDKKNNKPISDTQINIMGKSSNNKRDYNDTSYTNENGMTRFMLDKGSYRLSFNESSFPSQYTLPTPIFFDLKSAGTKLITINLETASSLDRQRLGILEIEVLNKDNKPVPYLELSAQGGIIPPPDAPDMLFSYTNTEGIAVFKVNEGSYKIGFTESKLPKKYLPPASFDGTSTHNAVARYTIRLVDAPPPKTPAPPAQPSIAKKR